MPSIVASEGMAASIMTSAGRGTGALSSTTLRSFTLVQARSARAAKTSEKPRVERMARILSISSGPLAPLLAPPYDPKMGIIDFVKGGIREMAIARPDQAKGFVVYKHPD